MSKALAAGQRGRGRLQVHRHLHRFRHNHTTAHRDKGELPIWPRFSDQVLGLVSCQGATWRRCGYLTAVTAASCQMLFCPCTTLARKGWGRWCWCTEAPAGTSADHNPPSQQHTTSAVQAVKQPVSKTWTRNGSHLLHKISKGPALTAPGGRAEENEHNIGLSPNQVTAGNGVWLKLNRLWQQVS